MSTAPRPGVSAATPPPHRARSRARTRSQGAWSNDKNSRLDHRRRRERRVLAEPSDHAIGRSRGGLTTKVHCVVDGRARPLVLQLTAGNVNDTTQFPQLMAGIRVHRAGPGRPRTRPDYLLADKGYSSRANREVLRRRGIAHTIPEPRDQQANRARRGSRGGRPVGFDKTRYKRRNTVERGFCQLKHWRGLATRYDRNARNYLGALQLAALLTWLP
nr:IS5 family transposase [Pseudonocardia hydrocarbonoxydans]